MKNNFWLVSLLVINTFYVHAQSKLTFEVYGEDVESALVSAVVEMSRAMDEQVNMVNDEQGSQFSSQVYSNVGDAIEILAYSAMRSKSSGEQLDYHENTMRFNSYMVKAEMFSYKPAENAGENSQQSLRIFHKGNEIYYKTWKNHQQKILSPGDDDFAARLLFYLKKQQVETDFGKTGTGNTKVTLSVTYAGLTDIVHPIDVTKKSEAYKAFRQRFDNLNKDGFLD
jgi:hypothetical protein